MALSQKSLRQVSKRFHYPDSRIQTYGHNDDPVSDQRCRTIADANLETFLNDTSVKAIEIGGII